MLRCPSDESQIHTEGGNDNGGDRKASYGFNYGYGTYGQLVADTSRRGPFWANPGIPGNTAREEFWRFGKGLPNGPEQDNSGQQINYKQINDGLSNTYLQLEMRQLPSDESSNNDRRSRIWVFGAGSCQIMTRMAPNSAADDVTACTDNNDHIAPCLRKGGAAESQFVLASRSMHPGGVNASKCDASAEFVSDGVDLSVWRTTSTMAGDDPPLQVIDLEGNGQ